MRPNYEAGFTWCKMCELLNTGVRCKVCNQKCRIKPHYKHLLRKARRIEARRLEIAQR